MPADRYADLAGARAQRHPGLLQVIGWAPGDVEATAAPDRAVEEALDAVLDARSSARVDLVRGGGPTGRARRCAPAPARAPAALRRYAGRSSCGPGPSGRRSRLEPALLDEVGVLGVPSLVGRDGWASRCRVACAVTEPDRADVVDRARSPRSWTTRWRGERLAFAAAAAADSLHRPSAADTVVNRFLGWLDGSRAMTAPVTVDRARLPGPRRRAAACLESVVRHGADGARSSCSSSTTRHRSRPSSALRRPRSASSDHGVPVRVLRNPREPRLRPHRESRAPRDAGDVVILNADTVVTAGWLDRLIEAAAASRDVATVTPLTNFGSICTLPAPIIDAFDLDGDAARRIDDCAEFVARRLARPPPGGHHRRRVLHVMSPRGASTCCGGFDDETFGQGYGEEVDFCLRASRLGLPPPRRGLDVRVPPRRRARSARAGRPGWPGARRCSTTATASSARPTAGSAPRTRWRCRSPRSSSRSTRGTRAGRTCSTCCTARRARSAAPRSTCAR